MARPTGKITICTICKVAPRDMTIKDANCLECSRAKIREAARKKRGGNTRESALISSRPFPRGRCWDCGVPVAGSRCPPHAAAYSREQARKYRARHAKPSAPKPKAEPRPKPEPRPAKPKRVIHVDETPVIVGPAAFPRLLPVAPCGVSIRIIPNPELVAQAERRDREWADWMSRRGL